ncbi:MAG: Gldg family protein [Sedimentisphaerales bacterium]|nr:Gldg family protein [Sedimentisphaerales bacterium]
MDNPKMTFRQVFFSIEGKIDRRTFWLRGILSIVIFLLSGAVIGFFCPLVVLLLQSIIQKISHRPIVGLEWQLGVSLYYMLIVFGLFCLITFIPLIGLQVKRCHDRGRSGLFMLLLLVPLGWFFVLYTIHYTLVCLYEIDLTILFFCLHLPSWLPSLWYAIEVGFIPGRKKANRFVGIPDSGSRLVVFEAFTFIMLITASAISISQNIGKIWKVDLTEQKIYTLSNGTKGILGRLNQPIKATLYYSETAALDAPDQIRYFNNYYKFVRALLEEYVRASKGLVRLEIIDPRAFSDDEMAAMRYGLQHYRISEEENFFFGLVLQTEFGVEKVIPFFSPDRQSFVEYDISYLIDTAITRQKTKVGILSSLPVMGDDSYMARMLAMQGQRPKQPWTIVEHLKKKYEVSEVPVDVNDINDVDILLVIHPKELPEKTQFAIDQYVLGGGRAVICVDPYCFADVPDQRAMQMGVVADRNSDLNTLLRTWGIEMPGNTFAGDKKLAESQSISRNSRPEPIIGLLNLGKGCFNADSVSTAQLNEVRVLFSGVLDEIAGDPNQPRDSNSVIEKTPLIMTTDKGNIFTISSPYELIAIDPSTLMNRFKSGTKPVTMGYLLTGRFKSSFPDGIELEVDSVDPNDPNETIKKKETIRGLSKAREDCAVAVFADVDFISDSLAYSNSFFGKVVLGDNIALLFNVIDDLSGSSDLISIRSRGNIKRPFVVVDKIEKQAEEETAQEVTRLNTQIASFQSELQSILSQAKEGEDVVIGSSILEKQRDIELKKRQAEKQLRDVRLQLKKRKKQLNNYFRNMNMAFIPVLVLVVAVFWQIHSSERKRHYISHGSDS